MLSNADKTSPGYTLNEWEIVEEEFKVENNYKDETIFSVGNGYIGMRGSFEEGYSLSPQLGLEGTYLNGFFESETIKYGEVAYGYAEKSQSMLNVTNSKIIKLFVEDEEFNMFQGKVINFRRSLNMLEGILKRELTWQSPKGKVICISVERIISLTHKNLVAIKYEIIPCNFRGQVRLLSELNGNVTNLNTEEDPRVGSGLKGRVLSIENIISRESFCSITQKTKNSKFTLVCSAEHKLQTENNFKIENSTDEHKSSVLYEIEAEKDRSICLSKFIAYADSRDFEEHRLFEVSEEITSKYKKAGFETIRKEQISFLKEFWYKSDIEIKGSLSLQQGIRYNMFQLLQSVGRDGKTNIAAKGLTGEGYEGHYFWDTETYMFPFFLYSNPSISKMLLEYRYKTLDKARQRARQLSHDKGALYPWRTINGEECSAYYPAGTAQYHINADIAFAVKRYVEATEDKEFLINYGAEMLIETARLWASLGDFIERKGSKFCINCVTGPDEYTAIVNNNFYTNIMARENLSYAYDTVQWMRDNAGEKFKELVEQLGLLDEEVNCWKKAADNMYLGYDEKLKIHPQDDSFMDKAVWDFKNTPKEKYPLLINYHPLVIYRYQVCKQADTVLAEFLLSSKFTKEQKKRDFDYYEPITTHDSSLSTCIFSIIASEIGYEDKAYDYFMNTARMDLDNSHGNTEDGIHAANMAGAWMCVVNGFAGMRAENECLSFKPMLPKEWNEYSFKVTYKGRLIKVTVNNEGTEYQLLEGSPISVSHWGQIKNL